VRAPVVPVREPEAAEAGSWRLAEGDEIAAGRTAVRLLGGGRRYEAYLAWDDGLLALVVAKVLRPSLVDDSLARAAVAAEAELLANLGHPVLVRGFDAVLDGPRPHIVLEHLEGPRLSTLLRTSVVAVEQVLTLGLQLASALHYLHRHDVLHLDVKPKNVIMGGPPRLIDLSVAKRLDEVDSIVSPIGTTAYMAPEQCDLSLLPTLGPPADTWGLGATLYEALAKRLPFPEADDDSSAPLDRRYPQLAYRPRPLPRRVPEPLAELVEACLEPNPSERPSPAALAAELELLVAGLPRPRLGVLRPGGRNHERILTQV
jgi:eukaryotic-like serine/threonine-protein kinase